jgi:hypothetical protein
MKYFPRDGTTFGSLIIWHGAVIKDTQHRKLYHVLGLNIKSLEKQNYNGLDYTYLHLNAYTAPNGVVTQDDIRNYINDYSPMIYPTHANVFNPDLVSTTDMNSDPYKGTVDAYWDANGWITVNLTYQPTLQSLVDNSIVDSQILQKVRDISYNEIFFDPHKNSRLTALAMLDLNTNAVFETKLVVTSKSVVLKDPIMQASNIGRVHGITTQQVRYVKSATVQLQFRRITDVHVPIVLPTNVTTYLTSVETKIEGLVPVDTVKNTFGLKGTSALSLYTSKQAASDISRSLQASVNQQLVILANWKNPYADNYMIQASDITERTKYYASNTETSIKISGLADLPPKQFKKTFISLMKFDYKVHKKKGHWYDAVVSIVIAVVAIVVAVASFGAGTPISTALMSAALALSIGAIAEGVWAMYLAKNGGSPGSIHTTMGISNILGIAAMVAGITAIYQSWALQMEKQAATEAAKKTLDEAIASEVGATVNSEAVTVAGNAYAEAFAISSQNSIGSILVQAVNAISSAGSKLGIIGDKESSIIGALTGTYDSMLSGAGSLSDVTLESVQNNIVEGVKKFFSKPLSEIMNQCINWINMGFNAYITMIAPANEGLADKQAQLDASNKEVQSTNPDNMNNVWAMYEDKYGSIFEVGDYVDKSYIMLTSGKNRALMNQCYDSGYKI